MAARRRPGAARSLLGYGGVILVVLLAPTLVVFSFLRSLPDSSGGGFRKHDAGGTSGGASGASRAAARPGPRLHEQLDSGGARGAEMLAQQDELQGGTAADRQQARTDVAAAALGRNAGLGHAGHAGGSGGRGKGAAAAGLHAGGASQQQAHAQDQGQQQMGQQQELQGAWQEEREHALPQQLQGEEQPGQQAQQQQQQEQQQQQGQQVRQGQVPRGQAVLQQDEPPDPQRHAARKQRYDAKKAQQVQQQMQPAVLYTGSEPRWPSALPKGAGKPQALPGCGDRDTPQQCATWAERGDCDANPGYMYFHCAAACGLCQVVYLHGNETRQQLEVAPGVLMPTVGYGTAGLAELTADAVFTAIRTGYRLVDSAQAYEWYQEDLVGWGWRASGIKREHLFITTKLHPRHHGYWRTLEMFSKSLKDLQTDYVDLLLLHYPECWGSLCSDTKKVEGTWQDSWFALEQLMREKKLRAAGVSNFNLEQMRELVQIAEVKPAVLQANSDLLAQNRELQAFCRRHGIQFQAYSSLGGQYMARAGKKNPVLSHPTVLEISQRLRRTPGQVVLRWALQHGQAVIPRTSKVDRMEQNLDLFSFDLADADMRALDALEGSLHRGGSGGRGGGRSSGSGGSSQGGGGSSRGGGAGGESKAAAAAAAAGGQGAHDEQRRAALRL